MKKIMALLGFATFLAFSANAQLKFQNGTLSLNTDGYTVVRPGATTYFRGGEHVFAGNYGRVFSIRIPSNGGSPVNIGSDGGYLQITDPSSYKLQDMYLGNIYNDASANTDIRPMENATAAILRLKPVTYRSEGQSGTTHPGASDGRETGFLAREMMQVMPNSVAITTDNKYIINYISVIPVLVKTIQEQNARIDALEEEIAALKRK